MTKAEAKREIDALIAECDPYAPTPEDVQKRIHELTKIAYPHGIPLPRISRRTK